MLGLAVTEFVAEHELKDTVAVASIAATRIYGLDMLAEGIQDDSDNAAIFLMLARGPVIAGTNKPFKTSIVFSLEEGPGALFKALAVFALRNINHAKPPIAKQQQWVLEVNSNPFSRVSAALSHFKASMADLNAQNALGHLEEPYTPSALDSGGHNLSTRFPTCGA
ncbi:Arogenate dehydratase 2 [Ancistrocladus abbreviatus]